MLREIDRPSPVPLPGSLVVKNGSKTASNRRRGTPVPLSRDRDVDELAVAAAAHHHLAAARHRIGGVQEQIEQHLHQTALRRRHRRQLGRQLARHLDVLPPRLRLDQRQRHVDGVGHAHRLDRARDRPRVVEQIGDDSRGCESVSLRMRSSASRRGPSGGSSCSRSRRSRAPPPAGCRSRAPRPRPAAPRSPASPAPPSARADSAATRHAVEVVDEPRQLIGAAGLRHRRQVEMPVGHAPRRRRSAFDAARPRGG